MRGAATSFFFLWLGNTCVNAVFGNYCNHLFGWGPEQSAPIGLLVGIVLALAPKTLVPRLGAKRSIVVGAAVYAAGLILTGLARTPGGVIASVLFSSLGCISPFLSSPSSPTRPSRRSAALY